MKNKRIGVLTSGGDCAGLNAAIRAITYHATQTYGFEVIGLYGGTTGVINKPMKYKVLTVEHCDHIMLRTGGTILGSTSKHNPFQYPCEDGSKKDLSHVFIEGYQELGLDALIAIGGDGSMKIMQDLADKGQLNLITIPKTIDNDLGHTEVAIGYSTALEIATEALDRLQPTANSHQRVMVLEVMGRDAGHIALGAGIAGGADVILIPEIPYSLQNVCKKIQQIKNSGRDFALVIVSESVKKENGEISIVEVNNLGRPRYGGIAQYLSEKISELTEIDARATTLGHVQRGAQPCALDRIIGSSFGVYAVDLVEQRKFNRMVAWQDQKVVDVAITDAIDRYRGVSLDDPLIKTAKNLGIYIGEI